MSVIMQHLSGAHFFLLRLLFDSDLNSFRGRPQMNLVNLSTAIHRVAKIAGADPWQQAGLVVYRMQEPCSSDFNLPARAADQLALLALDQLSRCSICGMPWRICQGQLRKNPSLNTLLNSVCTAQLAKHWLVSTFRCISCCCAVDAVGLRLNVVEATEVQPQSVSNAWGHGAEHASAVSLALEDE